MSSNLGDTALQSAVISKNYSTASALLVNGANPNVDIVLVDDSNDCSSSPLPSVVGEQCVSTCLREACRNRDAAMVDLLIRYGARDDNCCALLMASSNGDNHLMSKILSLRAHVDPEFKINKKSLQFNTGSCFIGSVTFSSLFPTTPVMINWHAMKGLTQIRKQWLIDSAVAHNIKLKLNVQNQVTAITAITRLDLSSNGLNQVPLCLFQMHSLKILNLSQNKLETLPETEAKFLSPPHSSKLESSKMKKSRSYSSALSTPEQTNGWMLPCLEELYLQDNHLECIPPCLFDLPALQLLDLSNNKLHSLPYKFWLAPKLRELNLSLNLLRDLPSRASNNSVTMSPSHKSRSPSKSMLEKSHKDGSDCSPIEETCDQSTDRPFHFSDNMRVQELRHVNLWNENVEVVAVSHNDDTDDIRQCCSLVSLNLSHNGFTRVPPTLSCLALNLTRLNMSYNCLQSLGCIKSFPVNLKHVDLSQNQISEWFKTDFDGRTGSIESSTCYCDFNQTITPKNQTSISMKPVKPNVYCIHKQHNKLDNLRTLILANNKLSYISLVSDDCDIVDEFEALDSNYSDIKGLKQCKFLFPNISMLDVSNNVISEIPTNIADLTNLSVLNLSGNRDISYLPPEMGLLNKLWNLNTRGCNLNEPLKTMVESKKYKTMDIIGYLKSILENSKPYARMKLMIVGVQGIGKTSLLELLRQEGTGTYRRKPPEHWGKRMGNKNVNMKTPRGVTLSTVGVDVCDWTYEMRAKGQPNFGAVTFRTWDFGGQREYYATHQYFLSKRSLYLVIWKIIDGEKGVDGIFQWLVNIQARAPNAPVIIVGTHYDQVRDFFPPFYSEELQQNIRERFINVVDPDKCGLPRVVDTIEVSIKTKHNVKLLCNLIYNTVFDLRCPGSKERLLEQKIPATYIALEDVVTNLSYERRMQFKDPVLRLEQYKCAVTEEMMNRYGMTFRDVSELHQATNFLHENGVLLHYEDSTLKDLYFLDPQWLCDMLAHVVTIREINPYARNGLMKTEDLRQLFKLSACAPTNAQSYLLNLLNKFEVALTWDSRTLLIPSLLPSEENLRAGLPGCDVRIPVRSRTWAIRKSYQNVIASSAIKINIRNETCFEPKRPNSLSLDDIHVAIPANLDNTEMSSDSQNIQTQPQCFVSVTNRPTYAIHRLILMTYFPSGFWSRLMTRILADDSIIEIVRSYFVIPNEALSDPILISLFNSKAEWLCWQTGMALRHFDTFLIRVKEVFSHLPTSPYDYYNMKFWLQLEGQWKDVQVNKSSILEIYLPNQSLFVQTKNENGLIRSYNIEPNQELVSKLLVIVVDHMDTLLEDWYPTLGTRFVHTSEGKFLVTRLVPCSHCLISQMSPPINSSSKLSSSLSSKMSFTQSKSPDDIEWQMIDFNTNDLRKNDGSHDSTTSRDSGVGYGSHDSSRFSSTEGVQYFNFVQKNSCDKILSQESLVIYSYMVEECILAVYEQKSIVCPIHGKLNMQTLAPDTIFYDLGDHYLIKTENIRYGKLLGRGAFGFVFRANVKHRSLLCDVAMKMLQPVDPGFGARKSDTLAYKAAINKWERDPMQYACKAYCTARQELNILLYIKHQNIVPLFGLCTKPLSLILQLAPLGSLDSIIKNYRRSGAQFDVLVLQKIVLDIARALEYLHQQHIIYRDLKSENVLVWYIPQPFEQIDALEASKVNIKLADYGISRPTLPTGTKGFGGTEGFMAPEIMRYNGEEEYTEKVDCFSFGMFMYELLTLRLPFENQECVKEHILEGGRPSLNQRDVLYPSYFIDLMTLCWSQQPKDRPSISQIVSIISAPEFTHLLDVISLTENYAFLSAAAVKMDHKCLQVCLSRIGKHTDVITNNGLYWTDYHTISSADNITVTSICFVNGYIWLGDSKACVHIYSIDSYHEISTVNLELDDNTLTAIRWMCYISDIEQVAISTTSGHLWICNILDLSMKEIGNNGTPFLCIINADESETLRENNSGDCELWCGQAEGNISIFTLSKTFIKSQNIISHYNDDDVDNRISIIERLDVFQMVSHSCYVWSYLYPGCVVYQWDVDTKTIKAKLDVSKLAPCSESLMSISIEEHLTPGKCQVTSMAILEKQFELYIGTTWGCIIIVEANTMRPITVFRPYEDDVKAIIPFKNFKTHNITVLNPEDEETSSESSDYLIATIGKGYRNLLSRFLHLDKNKSVTQKGLHAILWTTKNWALN